MTRALTAKKAVSLLESTFAAHGATITHTEVLNTYAKMEGFNAWSHYQAASKSSSAHPVAPKSQTLLDVLIAHYGIDGSLPCFSRQHWLGIPKPVRGDTAYWPWALQQLSKTDEYEDFNVKFKCNPAKVTLPSGQATTWNIEQNLTDRWGDLNPQFHAEKPGLAVLTFDEALLDSLRAMMADEQTFIVRKDGRFGLLIESEFCSYESENGSDGDDRIQFKPHAEMKAMLLAGMKRICEKYPRIEFAYPDESNICNDRPAVWGFVPLNDMTSEEISAVCDEIYNF